MTTASNSSLHNRSSATLRNVYIALPLVAAILVACGLIAYTRSVAGALAFLAGQDFVVEPALVDVGVGRDGEQAVAAVRVRNFAWRPLKVLGVVANCSCIQILESPVDIEPRSVGIIRLQVAFTGRPGTFQQAVTVYCDSPGHFRAVVPVRGSVGS